jgi:hypothetical protein
VARVERTDLIRQIEAERGSRVITYICSDRPGAAANIGDDAVRPMYEHVLACGPCDRIDLYLYSRGGAVEVPWRIVNMLREYGKKLGVLIPYRAHSAATLIALGCDEVVMGSKAELGPIDPALSRIHQEGGTPMQEEIRIEDVMSYISFIKDKAGLGDQTAIAENVRILAEKLSPWVVGSIYRTHSHIRMVARKLLAGHASRMDDQRMNLIVDSLAEKTYLHGHGISRREAEELGLPITKPTPALERLMWQLLERYETMMEMRRPVDPETLLGPNDDEGTSPMMIAVIESNPITWAFRGTLKLKRIRQAPTQVNVNLNLGVQLPAGIDPAAIPQQIIQQLVQQVQQDVPRLVQEQLRAQAPVLKTEGRFVGGYWQDVTAEGV